MRRPVGVKCSLFFCWTRFFSCRVAHCRYPSIRTLVERFFARCQLGCSRCSRCCHLIVDLCFHLRWKLGQAINTVTGTRRVGFCSSVLFWLFLSKSAFDLCRGRQRAL